jgi:hypothetical protein
MAMMGGLLADAGFQGAAPRLDGAIVPRDAWRWQECKYLPSVEKFLKGLGDKEAAFVGLQDQRRAPACVVDHRIRASATPRHLLA